MPISIHLPADLLRTVDARARRLGLSRSQYIVEVLSRDTSPSRGWSPGFLHRLRAVTAAEVRGAEELIALPSFPRSHKAPPRL